MFFHEFVASDTWILAFKHKCNTCSRKVTEVSVGNCRESFLSSSIYVFSQFVTKREVMNEEEIKRSADQFASDVRALLPKYNEDFVLNTDQSSLEFEIHSNRTLSHQGEKTTLSAVRSINETTHNYTVQPMISLSGKIVGPIYLCLKEPKGRMSDNIKAHLYKADNVLVTCSASGKLTTSLVEYWRDHVLLPSISLSSRSLLLSDSWSGQSNAKGIYKKIKGLYRLEIPPKTTPKIQPLDVFFNRQYKIIVHRLYDRVILEDINIHLTERNNIICLHSLIHNQLSVPIFVPMIPYAWFKSGYVDANPGHFQTVVDVCFKFHQGHCDMEGCDSFSFIRCSYCDKILCFDHFFINFHSH